MREILLLAASLAASGCCKNSTPKGEPLGSSANQPAVSTPVAAPTKPPPTPFEEIQTKTTITEAIAYAKPSMKDTENELDKGTVLLTAWLAQHPSWGGINALPDTSIAKVLKDSDTERGKKICTGGSIIQISSDKVEDKKIYRGTFMTSDVKYMAYVAVASTGELVERSPAKFCGVVIGTHSYSNAGGGTTHAIRIVGMFDLPENRKNSP